MYKQSICSWCLGVSILVALDGSSYVLAQPLVKKASSYMPVDNLEAFQTVMTRMASAKDDIAKKHQKLLEERYDLSDHAAENVLMSRGKPLQSGSRIKLPRGNTWDKLTALSPKQIRDQP